MNINFRIILLSLLLSACSSMPAGDKSKLGAPTDEFALVYLLNNIGGVKMGGELMVVNGVHGGTLDRREYTWFLAPPGELKLSFNDTWMKSRKLTARVLNLDAASTYYIGYSLSGEGSSDATLIYEAMSGDSDGKDEYKSSDISLIDETDAMKLIETYDLVGNKFDKQLTHTDGLKQTP